MEQIKKEYKPTSWKYFILNTTDCYVKLCDNKTSNGLPYKTFYFYKQDKNGKDVLKFSTFASNCFVIWEGKERFVIVRCNPETPNDIKLINYFIDTVPSKLVRPFSASAVWYMDEDD